jgi:phosphatidate cytidylyltransferase
VLRTRLATAAVAIPALWLFIYAAPEWAFAAFIVVVTAIGLAEYFAMALPDHQPERVAGTIFGLVVAAGVATRRPDLWGAGMSLTLVAGLAFPLVRHADLTAAVNRVGLQLLGVLYVGFFMPHAALMRALDGGEGWRWLLFTIGAVFGSDTGGYFAGRFLGRRKLLPEVSPKKTVEGAIGAVVAAVLAALLMQLLVHPAALTPGRAAMLAVIVSVLAQFGDLVESALKRAFGAKDSGWIIPGHGGILDRLDSLLFPFVFTYYYAAMLGR